MTLKKVRRTQMTNEKRKCKFSAFFATKTKVTLPRTQSKSSDSRAKHFWKWWVAREKKKLCQKFTNANYEKSNGNDDKNNCTVGLPRIWLFVFSEQTMKIIVRSIFALPRFATGAVVAFCINLGTWRTIKIGQFHGKLKQWYLAFSLVYRNMCCPYL